MNDHPNFEYDDRLFPFNDIANYQDFPEDEQDSEEKEPSTELNPLDTDGA